MSDFSIADLPQETQDYIRSLRSEAAKYRTERNDEAAKAAELATKYAEAGSLLQKANQDLSELSAVKDANEKNSADLAKTTSELERARIAWEAGLTPEDIPRLQGSTPEELKADAEKMAARLGAGGRRTPPKDPAAGGTPSGDGAGKNDGIRKAFEDAGLLG